MEDKLRPKLRAVRYADGRVGWPDAFIYELAEGPHAGLRMPCPPMLHGAYSFVNRQGYQTTYSYRTIIHDLDAYEDLSRRGWVTSEDHTGAKPVVVDNRPAPGA